MPILSAEQDVVLNGDPYALPDGLLPGTPPSLQRVLVTHLVLAALNAKDQKSAFQSFRENWPADHYGKLMSNDDLAALLTAFTTKHPHLTDYVYADQGIPLMNADRWIAALVHRQFAEQGLPVLSVHDSFIIDYTRVAELKRVMAEA